jgi:hypothetical protein
MANGKFISKLLRLVGLRVCDVWFKERLRELHLHVKPHKNGAQCPQCQRRGKIVRTVPEARIWRDVPVCGWAVFFHYFPREIDCLFRSHGHGRAKGGRYSVHPSPPHAAPVRPARSPRRGRCQEHGRKKNRRAADRRRGISGPCRWPDSTSCFRFSARRAGHRCGSSRSSPIRRRSARSWPTSVSLPHRHRQWPASALTPPGALIVVIQEVLGEKHPEVVMAVLREAVVDYLTKRPTLIDMADFIGDRAVPWRFAAPRRPSAAVSATSGYNEQDTGRSPSRSAVDTRYERNVR